MTAVMLDKLREYISDEFANIFLGEDIEKYLFVPLRKQADTFYIAITGSTNKKALEYFLHKKLEDTQLKIINLSYEDFMELKAYYYSKVNHQTDENIYQTTEENDEVIEIDSEDDSEATSVTEPFEEDEDEPELVIDGDVPEVEFTESVIEPVVVEAKPEDGSLFEFYENKLDEAKKDNATAGTQSKKKIGEILIQEGYLTEQQLLEALVECRKDGVPIGSMLVKMGHITIDQLKNALSEQQGFDFVSSEQLKIDKNVLNILPEDFIRTNQLLPISSDGKSLILGMIHPNDKKAINEVVYLTGLRPRVMIITHFEYQSCLDTYYTDSKKETTAIMRKIEQESLEYNVEESLYEQVEREVQDSSGNVAKFVNKIITDAIDMRASDIHIEPRINNYAVRYRKDGILKETLRLPNKVESQIITRFKVLSRMNIAEHRRSQDGTFSIKYKNNSYDFRINTLPVAGKEKMVIRVLAPTVSMENLEKEINLVGGLPDDISRIKRMIASPNGIILATGPTGSGKTTTLYSVLQAINDEKINITTIEDPVEIKFEGINQSQINVKAGITFASCMRSILRQDPDVILVGEIRDLETLDIAISAALTGHLVLSTLHTNSASATITRLIEMGAKDYLVSSTLTGVIAQRLVRRLCPHCKEGYHPDLNETAMIVPEHENLKEFTAKTIYRKKGCEKCDFEGYAGRLGVFEVMSINKEIKKLIAQGAHDIELEEVAVANGMRTLYQGCLDHIISGETTVEEFVRVLGPVNE